MGARSEDVAATPGWVELRVDEILRANPSASLFSDCRDGYLECLARCKEPADPDEGRDRCRAEFIACLAEAGVKDTVLAKLNEALEGLEQEISDST